MTLVTATIISIPFAVIKTQWKCSFLGKICKWAQHFYDVMIEILLKNVFQIWSTVFDDIRKLLNTVHRTGPQGYKTIIMLNSAEHENFNCP